MTKPKKSEPTMSMFETAAFVLTAACEEIPDLEIAFNSEGPDIYWLNVRIRPSYKEFPEVLKMIKRMTELGAVGH